VSTETDEAPGVSQAKPDPSSIAKRGAEAAADYRAPRTINGPDQRSS